MLFILKIAKQTNQPSYYDIKHYRCAKNKSVGIMRSQRVGTHFEVLKTTYVGILTDPPNFTYFGALYGVGENIPQNAYMKVTRH